MADEKTTRRQPSRIRHMVETKEVATVQSETLAKYGFRLNADFAADLIRYVGRKHEGLPALVASKDPVQVRNDYRSLYGSDITDEYANDLIAFFEKADSGNE